ncbi:type I polyketide synthase, partial [Streptomyces sp. SA3_actF]|uniref:type I polyketide synthase n=1 Tax=Streptomyces sp. SA3_actF TaxID=682181 RepID=UPI00131A2E76
MIGIGCRLPGGAGDHRAYWRNLVTGKDCVTPTPADRYDTTTLGSRHRDKPGRLTGGRGGYIDGFDRFEPAFFGISGREADHMDPQQRKLLEVAWEALEDGGQRPQTLVGSNTAVYVGAFTLDYKILQFADLGFETLAAHTATGTMMTMVSNRISHVFDFRGPSLTVDTACSSSLVTVHLARQALLRGETDLALAGGVLLHMTPQYTIAETKGGFLSRSGSSRAFDASAEGYVRAEGVGLVALKRLSDALRDGDPIHAVLTGSGVNQDGRTPGITVPSGEAQTRLVREVCADAGISPGQLQYVEAHGTSTPVGDPIEANALARVLAEGREPGAACYVGSVKTNIGHTESAAGIAGLIKTALAVEHKVIPPHLHLDTLNPAIDADSLPYEIPAVATPWPAHEGPARAGVNSFGFGGTNAHLIIEEAPARPGAGPAPLARPWTVLPLSTRHPEALARKAAQVRDELDGDVALADLGHTLAHRRQHLETRLAVVHSSRESLREALDAYAAGNPHPRVVENRRLEPEDRRLVWVYTGMGPQWWGMGQGLLASEPVFRAAVEECDREIRDLAGWSLLEEMGRDAASSRMAETWLAQPANFAVQYGLSRLWRSYGVRPEAIVGHSTGEIAAFHEAGVYTLREACAIAVHRSRLQHKLAGTGGMLAVGLPEEEAERELRAYRGRVAVAAVNSPGAVTLAGDTDALEELAARLTGEQIFAKALTVEVPYHSHKMDAIKDELLDSLAFLDPQPPQVPLELTGMESNADGVRLDAAYWWRNVRERVHFRSAVDRLARDGHRLFLEIGPHPALAHSLRECAEATGHEAVTVPSIRRAEDEPERFAVSLATLHTLGRAIDWDTLQPTGTTVPLPAYPWREERHWVEPANVARVRLGHLDHPLLGRRSTHAAPTWESALDTERLPYLADHQIQGTAVFPAAGYVEMAAQAVRALTGAPRVRLAGIDLRKALFLAEDATSTVQLSVDPETAAFTIATPGDADTEPVVHAAGVLRSGQPASLGPVLDVAGVRARADRRLDAETCYAGLAALGYHYGPAFQAIEEVWTGEGEVLAKVRPPAGLLGPDAADHHLHPVLLDACFQALLTRQIPDGPEPATASGVRLPLSLGELDLAASGDRALWVHGTVTRDDGRELLADLALYDAEDGTALGRVTGFRAADIDQVSTTVSRATVDSWLAVPEWVPVPALDATPEPGAEAPRDWLVLADTTGVADAFAALVRERGDRCRLVRAGTRYARDEAGDVTLAPEDPVHLDRLFAELDGEGAPFRGEVVHLWNLGHPALAGVPAAQVGAATARGAWTLVALARVLR